MILRRFFLCICVAFVCHLSWASYTIYPVPHTQSAGTGTSTFSKEINVVCESGVDTYTKSRLEEILTAKGYSWTYSNVAASGKTNLYLGINGSNGVADNMATNLGINRQTLMKAGKFDRHFISFSSNNIVVLGEHTNAVFFGLASVEQMLEQPSNDGSFADATIYDYADLQYRGVVEGYYGYPWTYEAKLDLMDFFKRFKMNTYLYGAKSDPYHSGYWDQPYPTSITTDQTNRGWLTQDMIKAIAAKSLSSKVSFIWAVHPGVASPVDFSSTSSVDAGVKRVMNKFDLMYNLGIRQFGVFLDDCSWSINYSDNYAYFLTQVQNQLDSKYNKYYTNASDTVRPIHFVPSPYTIGGSSTADMQKYFGAIGKTDPKITIYMTGWNVWSRPSNTDFNTMKSYLGRKASFWWNYPCNDNADSRIYMTDMLTTMSRMRAGNLGTPDNDFTNSLGIVSNPMQEGEVSKICLFGIADYAWNNGAFDSKKNWNASFPAIVGSDNAKALRYFADYGINEDPASINTLINKYKSALSGTTAIDSKDLMLNLDSISWCCNELRNLSTSVNASDRLLYTDLKPWINKLFDMVDIVRGFINLKASTDSEDDRWLSYASLNKRVSALSTSFDYVVQTLEGAGVSAPNSNNWVTPSNTYIAPFTTYLNNNIMSGFFPKTAGAGTPSIYSNATVGTSMVYIDANTGVGFLRTVNTTAKPGEYVGVNFNQLQKITDMVISDDVYTSCLVQYSADGKNWIAYNKGDAVPTENIAYIRFVNKTLDTIPLNFKKSMFYFTIPVSAKVISSTVPSVSKTEGATSNMYDGDYSTFYWSKANQVTGDAYQFTLAAAVPVYDVRICFGGGDTDAAGSLDKPTVGKVQTSLDGNTWTDLKVTGTSDTSFRPTSIKQYSSTVDYIDMTADGTVAKYVRFYVATANTSRWMKINEIEVNKKHQSDAVQPIVTDGAGNAIPELIDGEAPTKYSPSSSGTIYYRFIQSKKLNGVKIYSGADAFTSEAPTIYITTDGTTWTEKGKLQPGVTSLDMTSTPDVTEMKITWTAKSAPVIYEIIENGTTLDNPVNGIEQTSLGGNTYKPVLSSRGGIYTVSINTRLLP
jgi:hyaluronoglucosaminidase